MDSSKEWGSFSSKGRRKLGKGIVLIAVLVFFICLSGLEQGFAQVTSDQERTNMVILVDRSGSMKKEGGDPRGLSQAAVEYLLDQLELANDTNQGALILFNSKVRAFPPGELTSNFETLRSQLGALSEIKGNTDLEEALQVGMALLAKSEGRKQMVLISDGMPEPDLTSARIDERFPDQVSRFRRGVGNLSSLMGQLSQLSMERIRTLQFGVLRENSIEVYPVALTGIEANGEDLLRELAVEVTRDSNAFIKVESKNLVSGLDSIVPKPVSLMNVERASLDSAGYHKWSMDFQLDSSLERARVLVLYGEPPAEDISWELTGPVGKISASNPGAARYLRARDRNGQGDTIFERIFLDQPPSGQYTLTLTTGRFLPPLKVIVEGRTHLRLVVVAQPNPAEVNMPVNLYCRLEGTTPGQLETAKANIVNEKGDRATEGIVFSPETGKVLRASWVPPAIGSYRMHVTGYLDAEKTRYLHTQYDLYVQPRQAVKLRVRIPGPK